MSSDRTVEYFIDLTEAALSEKDFDCFVGRLTARETVIRAMISGQSQHDEVDLKHALLVESELIERLEYERSEVLKVMTELSKTRKATNAYSPRSPLPAMPVFFDRNE